MIHTLFWLVLLSKYVFWLLAPESYFEVMMLWIALLAGLAVLKVITCQVFVFPRSLPFYAVFLYVLWSILCCFLPWSEGKIAGVVYALLPLLVWPFIPSKNNVNEAVFEFCTGVVLAACVLVIALLVFISPSDLSSRDSGLTQLGPNTISFILALGAFSAGYLAANVGSKLYALVFTFLGFIFLAAVVLTFSKTMMLGCIAAVVFSHASLKSVKSSLATLGVSLITAVFIAVVFLLVEERVYDYLDEKNSVSNLSGRTLVWEQILNSLNGWRFILGAGYNSSLKVSQDAGFYVFGTEAFAQAHNAVVEAIINTGLIGAVLLVSAVLLSIVTAYRRIGSFEDSRSARSARYVFSIMFILVVRSVTEGSFAQPGTVDSGIVFFMIGVVAVVASKSVFRFSLKPT